MPHALSYPALQSVLEYLEIEKRIHLTSRSKFLQRIDKAIPVRANRFYIWENILSLDSYRFYVKPKQWTNKNGKLMMSYLKGRSSVNVDVAVFNTVKSSQDIPVKLDLTINRLKTVYSNLEVLIPMINPRSLPLANLSMVIEEPTNVDHGIVHSAKYVYFGTLDDLIGLEKLKTRSVREVMADLQEEFNRARDYSEEINEHFLTGFSISLSSTSKLLVYGIEKVVDELVLKVM
ncbi:hypothetical protein GCK72_007686 [Caenorhabditis remanei]|uniref:F-box domain-containing protein n=1 Tax=Caenorhabditis remanei TaxID=31234 RepID=A0A6A5HN12_CAERE|nr:hypothetical protein GCK72_007686 [Caenorhabditis remanei]KAF1767727.1 hypothetical protein GCK72_007686 [Caenorhabditis remanei]